MCKNLLTPRDICYDFLKLLPNDFWESAIVFAHRRMEFSRDQED